MFQNRHQRGQNFHYVVGLNAENRNKDRSQCKPLRCRNSDLLTDSTACICLYPPPPRKNHTSAMSFSAASHTTYSIIGISLPRNICLQGGGVSGSEIQKLLRNPSKGRYSDVVKFCIGFYLDSYSLAHLLDLTQDSEPSSYHLHLLK